MAKVEDEINKLMEPEQAAAVRRILEPAIQNRGLDLVLVEFRREQGNWILRVFVGPAEQSEGATPGDDAAASADAQPSGTGRAQGGVTLADCQAVSKEVSAILDVADPIPQRYVLEVSSPGIERPLVKPHDFVRFAGSTVRIRAARPLEGRQNFKGQLKGLEDGYVVIEEPDGVKRISYADIKRANLVYEF